MTHDIKGCLVEAVEALEDAAMASNQTAREEHHDYVGCAVEAAEQVLPKLRALIEQVPDGLDQAAECKINWLSEKKSKSYPDYEIILAAKLLHAATQERDGDDNGQT